jgi:hypothetical protein
MWSRHGTLLGGAMPRIVKKADRASTRLILLAPTRRRTSLCSVPRTPLTLSPVASHSPGLGN